MELDTFIHKEGSIAALKIEACFVAAKARDILVAFSVV